ncbi:MAG: hypothetical protein JWM11_3193 [Planctomycetaceae bacterium]|nr:hypothetical protein [Planctomycetaceae bacterium]
MSSRIYQVCLTYLTRWNFWLFLFLFFLIQGLLYWVLGFTFESERTTQVSPEIPRPAPKRTIDQSSPNGQAVSKAKSLKWYASPESPLKSFSPKQFPQLLSLEIIGPLNSEDELQSLQELPQLQALSVASIRDASSLRFLSHLTELRYLSLPECEVAGGLHHLRDLTKLKTLACSPMQNQTQILDELPQLRAIRTLVFDAPLNEDLPENSLARLLELPNLRSLYLKNEPGPGSVFDRTRKLLPRVKVRPVTITKVGDVLILFLLGSGLLFAGPVLSQLRTQFSHPGAVLTPGFAAAHLIVAGSLWGLYTAVLTFFCWRAGNATLASLAIVLFIPSSRSARLWLNLIDSRNIWKLVLQILVHFMTSSGLMFAWLFAQTYLQSDIDWFLRGEQPLLAVVLIAAGLLFPILAMRRLVRLPNQLHEASTVIPALNMSVMEQARWNAERAQQAAAIGQAYGSSVHSGHLEAVLSETGRPDRAHLWIAGNWYRGRQIAAMVGIVAVGVWPAIAVAGYFWGEEFVPLEFLNVVMPVQIWLLLDSSAFVVSVIWSQRRPLLATESLRPMDRKQLVRELFTAVACDLAPVMLCQLLGALVTIWMSVSYNQSAGWILAALLCFLVRAVTFYAVTLFSLINRNPSTTWLVVGFIYLNVIFASICLFTLPTDLKILLIPQACSLFFATFVLYRVRKYWHRVELG